MVFEVTPKFEEFCRRHGILDQNEAKRIVRCVIAEIEERAKKTAQGMAKWSHYPYLAYHFNAVKKDWGVE